MSDLGRKLRLAGILLFVVWILITILLSLFGIIVGSDVHTIMILSAVAAIALGMILEKSGT
jgi:hypothetical protein